MAWPFGTVVAGAMVLLIAVPYADAGAGAKSPFIPGSMKYGELSISPKTDGSPMYSTVYFPLAAGNYTPIFFLGGLYGIVSTNYYSDFLISVAKHGYVVVGIDRFRMTVTEQDMLPDDRHKIPGGDLHFEPQHKRHFDQDLMKNKTDDIFKKQMDWLRANLTSKINIRPDWGKLTVACHSASCDDTLKIVRQHPSYAAASLFLDPVSFSTWGESPVPSNTVALSYMSEKSFQFPNCCVKGFGFKRIYELMTSTKLRMSVTGFGHCDILDMIRWDACHAVHFCPCGEKSKLVEYKQFTAGMVHGFLRWSLDGDKSMEKYVLDQDNMPLAVNDFAFEIHQYGGAQ